ncbi:caprin-1b isoform X1 [Takifugu rubripes]|uniref:caprin-1b isoform X1 n=1 Tax=Takifugu rubripes TaxID=31033 RepID=UPI0000365B1C|nr:caprin-1 isoform X1 [Takifugu rubripes]XP_056908493.1 caprin-1b isoform X1 [Takifugu flavidus]
MPSVMNANGTVLSVSPDVGSAPGSLGSFSTCGQSEVLKQVLIVIEKKARNMEKKKSKLDDYQVRKNSGERLNHDQLEALSKYQEVMNNLEFARELHKTFLALGQDLQKVAKKSARREQLLREEAEQRRLKNVLELQFILDRLGDDSVRQDLKQGVGGSPLLTDAELAAFDEFYKLVGPDREQNMRLTDKYEEASVHLWDLLEGRDKAVVGTTYKALKDTLDLVLLSGYFDRFPPHQNGCEEEEDEEPVSAAAVALAESSEAEEQAVDPETELIKEFSEPITVEITEFVNRQFIPDGTYNNGEKEQGEEWTAEMEAVAAMQQQPVQPAASPVTLENHPLNMASSVPAADPMARKQVVQDLMAQMQGTYNFMQDSMLEFDGQAIDPAIVSAQPMKPTQNIDLPQMVCPLVHPESRLSQPNAVPVQPEPTQVPIISPTPPPMYQNSHTPDPRPPTEPLDPIQTSMSLASEQPPPSSALPSSPQTQVFQPVSKAPHSSGINVNAAPFQSMQTVFNLNAPVPPASETEALNQANQYQNSYNQAFSSQPQHPVEQSELQSEQLQSVVGAFHSPDQSGGHQQPSQQGPGFNRQPQSFYTSRGMSRGGPRNARGAINGYRGSSNGFRGSYDGYRPPFANTANSGYVQNQFNTPRDYPNGNYQRDGYQQNYKRGTGQGPRGVSRGSTQAIRS